MSTENPTTAKVPGQMFDELLTLHFRQAAADAFVQHGDVLRSVVIVFDYYRNLNDADVAKGLWLSANGPVTSPDSVVGSAANCLRIMESILHRASQIHEGLHNELLTLQREIVKLHNEQKDAAGEETAKDNNG